RDEGREGIAKIQKDLLNAYPCTADGDAFFPSRSLRSYSYTCFPTEDGVIRINSKQFVILKERLVALSRISQIPAGIFNTYLRMAAISIYEDSKLLPESESLSLQIERAARNRIKGPRSL